MQNRQFRKSKSKYKKNGYRQITMMLNKSKEFIKPVNHKRIYRIMKENNLLSEFRQRNPYKGIPGVTYDHKTFENIVNCNFKNSNAYNVLCTDITYLICKSKKYYLSAVKDSSTGKIVSYELSDNLRIDFLLQTIRKLNKGFLTDETIIHSDQGTYFTSPKYSSLLSRLNVIQSMPYRGKCTDNAPIESFFGHLK